MKKHIQLLSLASTAALVLSACGHGQLRNSPYLYEDAQRGFAQGPAYSQAHQAPRYAGAFNRFQAPQQFQRFNADKLVAVEGFQNGDRVKVKGPLWFKGEGVVHNITADAFKLEFSISSYHLTVEAIRIDESRARFITVDHKQDRRVEAIGSYTRNGNVTVFNMGKGQEVEKLTVRAGRAGYFEADVVQPGRLSTLSERGKTTLKFTKK